MDNTFATPMNRAARRRALREIAQAKPRADKEQLEVVARYCGCMEEIKLRTEVLEGFLTGKMSAKYLPPTVECECLQFRKILELIALGSLVAHKEEYSRQRGNFAQDWHAARILQGIEKINPAFYPVPTRQVLDPATGRVRATEDVKEPYLTRNDFVVLYDKCSNLLHAANPFGRAKDYEGFARSAIPWLSKIKTLLNHHQIQLADKDTQLWVLMVSKDDGKAHGAIMKRGPKVAGT